MDGGVNTSSRASTAHHEADERTKRHNAERGRNEDDRGRKPEERGKSDTGRKCAMNFFKLQIV